MIGFDEFVLVVIALSVPEKDVEVVFDVMDLDNNGVLDEAEFMQVIGNNRETRRDGSCGVLCCAVVRCVAAVGMRLYCIRGKGSVENSVPQAACLHGSMLHVQMRIASIC